MKLTALTPLLFAFTTYTSANPIALADASPNPAAEAVENLEAQADNWCWLNSDALKNDPQGCDTTPFSGSRKRGVTGGDRFGVRCTARGRSVNGYNKWDYVPGWGCWIWAGWTQIGCELVDMFWNYETGGLYRVFVRC
ncbi:hypothetical protein BDW02DRAFT_644132 [Decorospora gaudefroyi]|uniref:Uncharacterized protein n=1 Tax=Decorospora gaudefroyi TaxID=184978 RepID=A0A6A5KVK1_9PLEO|nr:hypothetical protein BDW02DRAFT_644132 [Decorospora gaudefroyi]